MTTDASPVRTPVLNHTTVTTVAEARGAFDEAGASVALVAHHGCLVGLLLEDDLDASRVDEPVGDVMTTELVHLDPGTGDVRTLEIYRDAAWASLRRRGPGRRRGAAGWQKRHEVVR
jgi:hypothetical protein